MSVGTLTYLGVHGRAGPMRMLLKHAKQEFEDKHVTMEQLMDPECKKHWPNGQLPMFQPAGSDKKLGQSRAILMMLGCQHGYVPTDPEGSFKMTFAIDCMIDWSNLRQLGVLFRGECPPEHMEAFKTEWTKMINRIAKLLEDGSPYLAGEKISVADFFVFSMVSNFTHCNKVTIQEMNDVAIGAISAHAHMTKWVERLAEDNKEYLDTRLQSPM